MGNRAHTMLYIMTVLSGCAVVFDGTTIDHSKSLIVLTVLGH